MRVSVLEVPAQWGQLANQLAWVLAQADARRPCDLLVLPEACLTGYVSADFDFDLAPVAEPLEQGVARLAQVAERWGCDVVGPVIERTGDHRYNSVVGVSPTGERWLHYRKRHPWMPETWATPGDTPWPLVRRHGLTLSCAVCFDLHFLSAEAAEALTAADVLLFPSAWVESEPGEDFRAQALPALARQFSLSVVNANWGRGVPSLHGQGGSMLVRPDGHVTRCGPRATRLDGEVGPAPAAAS